MTLALFIPFVVALSVFGRWYNNTFKDVRTVRAKRKAELVRRCKSNNQLRLVCSCATGYDSSIESEVTRKKQSSPPCFFLQFNLCSEICQWSQRSK